MKLETHTEDEKWLINTRSDPKVFRIFISSSSFIVRNLTQLSRVRDWRHLSSDKTIRQNLISQVSREQLNRVYENYKIDFEMFNYTMDKYLP